MDRPPAFAECDSEHVFQEVSKEAATQQVQALWKRLQAEVKRQGVGAAITYVDGEFDRLRNEFTSELDRAKHP